MGTPAPDARPYRWNDCIWHAWRADACHSMCGMPTVQRMRMYDGYIDAYDMPVVLSLILADTAHMPLR